MDKFKSNTTYISRHIGDSALTIKIKISRRTDKTVFFIDPDNNQEKKAKIHFSDNSEFFYPYGRYSKCPVLRAKNKI